MVVSFFHLFLEQHIEMTPWRSWLIRTLMDAAISACAFFFLLLSFISVLWLYIASRHIEIKILSVIL